MALYDGFFDAILDGDGEYDRTYGSDDFTGYFANIIGSGVCIYGNENSFRVRCENGKAVVSPGYLFIQGYYLKNTEDYEISLPDATPYAIVAHLDLGARTISLSAQSVAQAYPDSLVLGIATTSSAEDTRYNTDICGVIDTAGDLSTKVAWAVNYIDTQIDSKLAAIEQDIAVQEAALDAKIAEVQAIADRVAPPPIGTIKFTASQDVDSSWLRCDGSYINESEYPDLVAALGKLTPGVDDVTEMLRSTPSEQMSNASLHNGTVWVYLAQTKKLVGMSGSTKKTIAVSGADSLEVSPSIDIVLSVVSGAVYMAQNNAGNNRFVLLECATFTGTESSITMTSLSVNATGQTPYCVPSVTKIGTKVYVAYGMQAPYAARPSYTSYDGTLKYVSFTPGSFSSAKYDEIVFRPAHSTSTSSGYFIEESDENYLDSFPLFGFQKKNGNELVGVFTRKHSNGNTPATITLLSSCISTPQQLFNSPESAVISAFPNFSKNTLPVCANNECLVNVEIVSRHLVITYLNYNSDPAIKQKTVEAVSIPSRAKLFKDSVVYADAQGLWFVFTGTGLLFSEGLEEGNWGYLDTQSLIGYIGVYGCLNYDSSTNSLYLSGMSSDGTPKVARLKLPDLYDYANDGAFLPSIASDGVPAYIKATNGGGEESNELKVKVLEPTTVEADHIAEILFNGSTIPVGEFKRTVDETFTVGIQKVDNWGTGTYMYIYSLYVNGGVAATITTSNPATKTVTLYRSDYIKSGITLQYKVTRS